MHVLHANPISASPPKRVIKHTFNYCNYVAVCPIVKNRQACVKRLSNFLMTSAIVGRARFISAN